MIAKDVMTKDVITVQPTLPVKKLAAVLIKNHISGVPVADKRGKIVGVVSEADIIAKKGKQVRSIMNGNVISVSEDTPVEVIAQIMTTHKVKRLPVMTNGKVVGIVSRADIINAMALGDNVALRTPVYDL
jgi:CBS domain-containing protein